MVSLAAVPTLLEAYRSVKSQDELGLLMVEACRTLGFRHFAMVHHVEQRLGSKPGFRLHNYPERWVERFDRERLGAVDPVHRASQKTLIGFRWADVPALVPLSARDRMILAEAHEHGLALGFTVPAHVPGELLGSCSFAAAANDEIDERMLPAAQLVGQFAFEASRRMSGARPASASLALTSRQLECVMFVGRGKSDAEIATILGLSQNTITEHLKNARERYNAAVRGVLPIKALYDGALSFADLLES